MNAIESKDKINRTLLSSLVGFFLTLGVVQVGLLMILDEALESLLLLPILFLYVGAIVIGRRQDLVVASIFFLTTALIHMAASNLLLWYGMQKPYVSCPVHFVPGKRKMGGGLTIANILLTILLEV